MVQQPEMQQDLQHLSGKVLIIDDEQDICKVLAGILRDDGHRVAIATSAVQGMKRLSQELPDVVFLDVWLPDGDGVELLAKIRQSNPETSVIMISGHANIETAVKCTRLGAIDFIEKPLSLDKVLVSLQTALRIKLLSSENQNLRNRIEQKYRLIGSSKTMENVRSFIQVVSQKHSTVLITGENGTGKEVVARLIHDHSQRSMKPFIAINCAAIPEELIESELFGHQKGAFTGAVNLKRGKFELAHTGTIFLDEIGDMSLKTQSKVLRVLQEQRFERVGGDESIEVDVRVIAATNKDLREAIQQGAFREDLYYRLNVIPIELPPLRERAEDIEELATHYLSHFCRENNVKPKVFSKDAILALMHYPWPGNIRELKNMMERLSILVPSDTIQVQDLPALAAGAGSHDDKNSLSSFLAIDDFRAARAEFEKVFLTKKLSLCQGNVSKTADLIGMERTHLHRKLKTYEILETNGEGG